MSQNSLHLSLPYIQGGQAQKHITHNEAIRTLDALVQLSVIDQVQAPPAGSTEGDRVIVASGATGDFTGHESEIATYESSAWTFLSPVTGWTAYDAALGALVAYDGFTWVEVAGGSGGGAPSGSSSVVQLGINTSADTTNRLASAADATLLTHDASGGHQLKINKSAATDTASLLFQTAFAGHAEMGTTGSNNFEIKVSPDGTQFHSALQIDNNTGTVSFPNTTLPTADYLISRAAGLVTNGSGYLGSTYNFPSGFAFDGAETPGLPGAMSKAGYYSGVEEMDEFIAIDPNRLHHTCVYLRQESVSGDWSAFANNERHIQYMGFRCYDVDGLAINASHHMRYHHAGLDSLTTLTAPLAPGDTTVQVANAAGWNESSSSAFDRGIVIFEYKNALGKTYDFYSRLEQADLFEIGDVNKATGQITLNQGFPSSLANPDNPGGVWPIGTRIANRGGGWNFKFGFCNSLVLDQTDRWYRVQNAMGGIDLSGQNVANNFPPGTAKVRPIWMINYSNRSGGWSTYPDTGTGQRLWVTGVSVDADPSGIVSRQADGSCILRCVRGDLQAGTVNLAIPGLQVNEA